MYSHYSTSHYLHYCNDLIYFFLQFYKLLQQHISYKHETSKPWKCDLCDFAHSLKQGLDGHKRIAHPDKTKMKVCHICGYKAVTNQNLKTHVEAKHENIRNYSCNVCEAKFYNAVQLRNHVKGMLLLNF